MTNALPSLFAGQTMTAPLTATDPSYTNHHLMLMWYMEGLAPPSSKLQAPSAPNCTEHRTPWKKASTAAGVLRKTVLNKNVAKHTHQLFTLDSFGRQLVSRGRGDGAEQAAGQMSNFNVQTMRTINEWATTRLSQGKSLISLTFAAKTICERTSRVD